MATPRGDEPRLVVGCKSEDALEVQRVVSSMGSGDVLVDTRICTAAGEVYVGRWTDCCGRVGPISSLVAIMREFDAGAGLVE